MLLTALRSLLARRAVLRAEAAALIDAHGDGAWEMARWRAHDAMRGPRGGGETEAKASGDQARIDAAWQVVGIVERRLRIHHQPDTATRYLETPVRPPRPRPWSETPAGRALLDTLPRGRDGT